MFKLILAIIFFILGLSYLVFVIREHRKKKGFKPIWLFLTGLTFIANGVLWLLEYLDPGIYQ